MAEPTTIIHGDWSKDRRKRIGPRRLGRACGVAQRHCERSEAIQLLFQRPKLDCFAADAPRNDGEASMMVAIFLRTARGAHARAD
jgi:hypothetical protein